MLRSGLIFIRKAWILPNRALPLPLLIALDPIQDLHRLDLEVLLQGAPRQGGLGRSFLETSCTRLGVRKML